MPELIVYTLASLKNVRIRRGTVGLNKLHVLSMKSSNNDITSALKTVAMANKQNTDVNLEKLVAMIDRKIDEKFDMAKKELLDSMNIRFDAIRYKK